MRDGGGDVPIYSEASHYITFLWYCRDSDARAYARSRALSIAMVSLQFVSVPYYLVRSRLAGRKLRALLKLLGFWVLMFVATALGLLLAGAA